MLEGGWLVSSYDGTRPQPALHNNKATCPNTHHIYAEFHKLNTMDSITYLTHIFQCGHHGPSMLT